MSSHISGEESDPQSGYEADVSDEFSDGRTVVDYHKTTSSDSIIDLAKTKHSENGNLEAGMICIGCDVQDAGPGVTSDEDALFGMIWIGCSVRDMGFNSYQDYLESDDQPTVEHIEDVRNLGSSQQLKENACHTKDKPSKNCK
ncbi:hypothetical protein BDV18DRAFT_162872 [Aspergillus unguis]